MNLPKCPHGNEGAMVEYPDPHGRVEVNGIYCDCRVIVDWDFHTREQVTATATRAWAALCSPVTDERLREIVENATPHHDACKPLDGWCSAPCRFDRQERYDIARAVRDACEGKP